MQGIAIRLGIVGLIVIGGLVLRPFLTGNAGELKVGDCFDVPGPEVTEVDDVQHHPCDQDHTGEVIFVGDYPGSASDGYPTEDDVFAYLEAQCIPAFQAYTGIAYADDQVHDIGWFQPTEEGWQNGDQGMICYAYRLDEAPFKGSLKAAS